MTFEELKQKISVLSPEEILEDRIYYEIIASGEDFEENYTDLSIMLADRANELNALGSNNITSESIMQRLSEIEEQKSPFLEGFGGFVGFGNRVHFEISKFPTDCLPPRLQRYALAVAESIQVSPDMSAVAALGVASLCIQGRFYTNPKPDWILPLNLYIAIIARPSERKSPMLTAMTVPIYEYERAENEERGPAVKAYEVKRNILSRAVENLSKQAAGMKGKNIIPTELVIDKQRELSELEANPIHFLQLITDDVTMEALAKLLAENEECMAIVSSEGGIFSIAAGQYSRDGKANIDLLLKAYNGEPVAVNRVMRESIRLNHPLLTILLTIQPTVASEAISNSEFSGRGLIARFLYAFPESIVGKRKYNAQPIPQEVKMEYADLLQSLLALPKGERIIKLTPEAQKESELFHYLLESKFKDDFAAMEDWAGKYHGQIHKIAGILHVCEFGDKAANFPLELEMMNAAERIGEWFLENAKVMYDAAGLNEDQSVKDAKYVIKRFKDSGKNPITKRDLYRLCQDKKFFKTVKDLQPTLDLLVEHGYIRIECAPAKNSGGRPSELIYRNLLSDYDP